MSEPVMTILMLLGGVAVFIFGMEIMSAGLRTAAGEGLRSLLSWATRNRLAGAALGTTMGFLVQSSAATVMLVGFVNAGLLTLEQSVPPVLGANIGTTLSMQLISFKLGDFCFGLIAAGFVFRTVWPGSKGKQAGQALLGFGLLFLGMETMGQAIEPHRETLIPILERIDGSVLSGALLGVAIAAAATAVLQSSGATIGMCFALIAAGVLPDLNHVYPILLGAHLGTCVTALLGSLGTNIDARRCALAHLYFNVFFVVFGLVTARVFVRLAPYTSPDLVHQAANFNTLITAAAVMAVLPFGPWFTRLVRLLSPSRRSAPAPSFMQADLLDRPEKAIYGAIQELQRVMGICMDSYRRDAGMLRQRLDRHDVQRIRLNERSIDEIKPALQEYIRKITLRKLSRRQALLVQYIELCMSDIERIGDHVEELCSLSLRRRAIARTRLDEEADAWLQELYGLVERILDRLAASLDPEREDFKEQGQRIIEAADEHEKRSAEIKAAFTAKVAEKKLWPIAGIFFMHYVSDFDRITKHARSIAEAEKKPDFWIKRKKLDRFADKVT